jgi:hypothetical protein
MHVLISKLLGLGVVFITQTITPSPGLAKKCIQYEKRLKEYYGYMIFISNGIVVVIECLSKISV